jgi:hypothetical protein
VNYAKILLTSLFFTALPNFCMNAPEEMPEIVVLDDGRKWVNMRALKDPTQFGKLFGKKVVAARTSLWDEDRDQMGLSERTRYAFIDHLALATDRVVFYFYLRAPWIFRMEPDSYFINQLNWPCAMRLLTFNEMRYLCRHEETKTLPEGFPGKGEFTLGNLLEEEREPYFKSQVHKKMWQWQRLLHIGRRDAESAFYNVPKDMICLLTQYTFNANVSELMKNAKPEQKLDFE